MNGGGHPAWERLAFWLIAFVIGLELFASVLPRLVVPVALLAGIAIVVRVVWFYTGGGW
jgi:hypothetical protein